MTPESKGWNAAIRGAFHDDNPFTKDTDEHKRWLEGWCKYIDFKKQGGPHS